MGLKCFSSFWNNLISFCKPHQASVVGENSWGYISFGHNGVRFCPLEPAAPRMLDSDTAVRRYGLNTGLGCNMRLKEICSTSRNLHPLELGQNGANSRSQHFWFGTTWFHREKVVHIGPPPSGVPPKNIT